MGRYVRSSSERHSLRRRDYQLTLAKASQERRARYEVFLSRVKFLEADALKSTKYQQGDYLIRYGEEGTWFSIVELVAILLKRPVVRFQTITSYPHSMSQTTPSGYTTTSFATESPHLGEHCPSPTVVSPLLSTKRWNDILSHTFPLIVDNVASWAVIVPNLSAEERAERCPSCVANAKVAGELRSRRYSLNSLLIDENRSAAIWPSLFAQLSSHNAENVVRHQ